MRGTKLFNRNDLKKYVFSLRKLNNVYFDFHRKVIIPQEILIKLL